VDKAPTIVGNGRVTKQGVRDLNYYGPRRGKGVAEAPVADEKIAAEAEPPVTSAIGPHDEGTSK
jgi:hypothetical protein